ncbi:redoxin domain-containing protein [Aureliella helgolandensis]|uniref:Peroxiredoxin n=1 Tax=Aureliella helgolandensis TaxID=2527968 RepID=A0A518GGE8_9BACT|nr:redoxin domain-containing protein [Aureliella helgolandensis]QDV27666.1 Putative peroxiredoxin [Aureliella helgolandensis]
MHTNPLHLYTMLPKQTTCLKNIQYLPKSTSAWSLRRGLIGLGVVLCLLSGLPKSSAFGDEGTGEELLAGHSSHGEAFNEGPRQAAYLMPGMGNISFPVTTENALTQRFFNQGVAQLHGFWYYEAERSFRQAATLDPDCSMCYWGMAMANVENRERAQGFIAQAQEGVESVTPREKLFITAAKEYFQDEDSKGKKIDKKSRAQTYTHNLEAIVEEYPDDIEAKAFLAVQLWQNSRADLPIVSHVAINALLQQIFDANPSHPAHHYRIHLWDGHKAKMALHSAGMCGPSLPGIAHMWHMPGHIYSKLHRYQDAAWQQEASARVDHAHMMRDRVLPDQIHNYAHNNEWLIRNLLNIGRIHDALALAQNMQELPRHPKYNTLKKGSTKYGRERLLLALSTYRLWPELLEFAQTDYLAPTQDEKLQLERKRYMAVAYALTSQADLAASLLTEIEDLRTETQQTQDKLLEEQKKEQEQKQESAEADEKPAEEAASPDESTSPQVATAPDTKKAKANRERRAKERDATLKELKETLQRQAKAIATIQVAQAAAERDWKKALELWEQSDWKDNLLKAEWLAANDQPQESLELVDKEIQRRGGEVLPLAVKTWIQAQLGEVPHARQTLEKTRIAACQADLETPLLARLASLAAEQGYDSHWAVPPTPAADLGERPALDSLGSFRWHPYMAPRFTVFGAEQQALQLKDLRGQPTLVIFYLGFGCLHCIEQLHEFSPRAAELRNQGLEVLAISSENTELLARGVKTYTKPLDIPLYSDAELNTFKAYRCYDDFESQPLHGTFLISPDGKVLWQDISYEPFMDVDFILAESQRLLKLHAIGQN